MSISRILDRAMLVSSVGPRSLHCALESRRACRFGADVPQHSHRRSAAARQRRRSDSDMGPARPPGPTGAGPVWPYGARRRAARRQDRLSHSGAANRRNAARRRVIGQHRRRCSGQRARNAHSRHEQLLHQSDRPDDDRALKSRPCGAIDPSAGVLDCSRRVFLKTPIRSLEEWLSVAGAPGLKRRHAATPSPMRARSSTSDLNQAHIGSRSAPLTPRAAPLRAAARPTEPALPSPPSGWPSAGRGRRRP